MTIDEEYYRISSWITDTLTILACLIFFHSFARLKEKNYSLYMILVLAIVDFIHPIIDLILLLWDPPYNTAVSFTASEAALYELGLCWSTALAVLVSVVLTQKKLVNPIGYTIIATVVCVVMAVIPAIFIKNGYWGITVGDFNKGKLSVEAPESGTGDQIGYFFIFDVLCRVIPLLATCFCYLRVLIALKKYSVNSKKHPNTNTKPVRILCYLLIQIICFFPGVLGDIYNMFMQGTSPSWLSFIISTLHNCWGFLNLLAYWFLKLPRRYQSSISNEQINDMSLTGMSTL